MMGLAFKTGTQHLNITQVVEQSLVCNTLYLIATFKFCVFRYSKNKVWLKTGNKSPHKI